MKTEIIKYNDSLYLISLPIRISGFNNFIGAWVYSGKKNIIVDPGPSSTVKHLCEALAKIKIISPDYILLTHIHIDHAGSIGDIAQIFDKTPIISHSSAFKHLITPDLLWKSSVNILKKKAYAYGNIKPINKDRLIKAENFSSDNIKTIETPGHSLHSISFMINQNLFAGETCGVYMKQNNKEEYLRPATPPKFFFKTTINSIEKLIKLKPKKICFGHFGINYNPDIIMKKHIKQLYLWKNIIKEALKNTQLEFSFFIHI